MRSLSLHGWRTILRRLLISWVLVGGFTVGWGAPKSANAQPQPVAEEKKPEPARVEEPKKIERDGSSQVVHYTLAGIATLILMLLICMPARRD